MQTPIVDIKQEIKDVLYDTRGNISGAVVKTLKFKEGLFQKILEHTKFIPPDATLAERVYAIEKNISERPKCRCCANKVAWSTNKHKYALTCSAACAKAYSKSDERRSHMKKMGTKNSHSILNDLLNRYSTGDYKILHIDEVKREAHILRSKYPSWNYNTIKKNQPKMDLFCNILNLTRFIPQEEAKINWDERLYCINNGIDTPQKCNCGGSVSFNSHKNEYNAYCRHCSYGAAGEKRSANYAPEVFKFLEANNYQISNKEEIMKNGITAAQFKLTGPCGHSFDKWLYHGAWQHDINCPVCHPRGSSIEEERFVKWLQSIYTKQIDRHYKDIFDKHSTTGNRKEIDIFLPDDKIGIEYHGVHWHCVFNDPSKKRLHQHKADVCNKHQINLLQITSAEWKNPVKQDIWKSMIMNKLKSPQKIYYARKCTITPICAVVSSAFLDENHLQGKDNSKYRYGLFHNDELIAVMTFAKNRFNKKDKAEDEYELVRYSVKKYTFIHGAASKLFAHFIREVSPKSVVSYANRMHSNGNLYNKLGFKFSHNSNPNYVYVMDDGHALSRQQAQKKKLPKLLGDKFDPKHSESENMKNAGYRKIEDAGNMVFVWQK